MPTYEYVCRSCAQHLEVVQRFDDAALTECPSCQGALRKVFGNIGIAFKGSGFYKNDSRSTPKSGKGAGSKHGDGAKSDGGDGAKEAPSSSSGSGDGSKESSSSSSSSGTESKGTSKESKGSKEAKGSKEVKGGSSSSTPASKSA